MTPAAATAKELTKPTCWTETTTTTGKKRPDEGAAAVSCREREGNAFPGLLRSFMKKRLWIDGWSEMDSPWTTGLSNNDCRIVVVLLARQRRPLRGQKTFSAPVLLRTI
jgi:hypothetical protein